MVVNICSFTRVSRSSKTEMVNFGGSGSDCSCYGDFFFIVKFFNDIRTCK